MGLQPYQPNFKSADEVRELLVEYDLFDDELTIREVCLALEVLDAKHAVGKGKKGYDIKNRHLLVIAQYIDRDETISCQVDIA